MARNDRHTCTIKLYAPHVPGDHAVVPREYEGTGLTQEDALSDAVQQLPLLPATRKLIAEALR